MAKLTKAQPQMVEVPDTMWKLAARRGRMHLVPYRSIEANLAFAYLQGFHDALAAEQALAARAEHSDG